MATAALEPWESVLDALDQRLAAQEAVLELAAEGRQPEPEELLELVSFTQPEGLPPMPAVLGDRARRLLTRSHAVQDRVADLIETTRPRRGPRPPRAARRPSAINLDVRA